MSGGSLLRAISILKDHNKDGDLTEIVKLLEDRYNQEMYCGYILYIFPSVQEYGFTTEHKNPVYVDGVKRFAYGKNVISGVENIIEWIKDYGEMYKKIKIELK